MIYRPVASRNLWDTWLFPWNGEYHLFFLETQVTCWDHVGHAVSKDLVHWETRPSIDTSGPKGAWNSSYTLTGTVVRHDGKFYMFVGSVHQGCEVIGVYLSDDLEDWQEYPKNPVARPAGPYYLDKPMLPYIAEADWRDPCISYRPEDEHYHALVCARLKEIAHTNRGAAVGHMRSKDLINWELLEPIATPGKRFYETEVPDSFELDGRYYLAFSTSNRGGIRVNTPSRDDTAGTYYLIGERYEGPYKIPDDPLLVGAGQGKRQGYVGRTIAYEGGRLLYHQIATVRHAWCAPKRVRSRADGTLYLEYLPILEKLETGVVCESFGLRDPDKPDDLGLWEIKEGRLIGRADLGGSLYKVARELSDIHFSCRVKCTGGSRVGVVIRGWEDCGMGSHDGVSIILDFDKEEMLIGRATHNKETFGWAVKEPTDVCRMSLKRGRGYHLCCFVRDEHFEVYLDGCWVFTVAMVEAAKMGDVELIVGQSRAEFADLRIATIEPLA